MKNKKIISNIIFGILLAVALTLIIAGIVNIIKSSNVTVPNMLDPDWFDAKTTKNSKMFVGISLIFGGIFIVIISAVIRFALKSSAFSQAKNIYATVEKISQTQEDLILETLSTTASNSKNKTKKCPYCGSTLKTDNTVCPNCGAGQG